MGTVDSVVKNELQQKFDTHLHSTLDIFLKDYGEEFDYVKEYSTTGGKRFRPYIFLEALHIWDVEITERMLDIAVAIELLHSFLVIHDDLMDNDELRRGKPTLHTHFIKKTTDIIGRGYALSFGDLLYTIVLQLIQNGLPENVRVTGMNEVLQAVSKTIYGQISEYHTKDIPSKETIIHFYSFKTAEYSLYLPLYLACICAGKEDLHDTVRELAMALGRAYQIYDDVDELLGTKKRSEDGRCADIKRLKMTPLLVDALEKLPEERANYFISLYQKGEDISVAEEKELIDLIISSGILHDTIELMHSYVDETERLLPQLKLDNAPTLTKIVHIYREVSVD